MPNDTSQKNKSLRNKKLVFALISKHVNDLKLDKIGLTDFQKK